MKRLSIWLPPNGQSSCLFGGKWFQTSITAHTQKKKCFSGIWFPFIKVRDPHSQLATETSTLLEFPLLKRIWTYNSVLSDFTDLICVCVCVTEDGDALEFRFRLFLNERVVCHPNWLALCSRSLEGPAERKWADHTDRMGAISANTRTHIHTLCFFAQPATHSVVCRRTE